MCEKYYGYFIEKMADGGYIVSPQWSPGGVKFSVFSCTTIDEALAYVKRKLAPKEASIHG